ncbi:MAG TPA: SDR family oxidoreductase [Myxococcales bacterium]|nr:SDR family oxidoreductase [Myxococcales bacterium]
MRVFVTGAAGFVGAKVVEELKRAGHEVIGLARSAANEKALAAAGVQAHRGDVQDLESLRQGVAKADAVIHCAFVHDFTNFVASCEIDRRAIEAMGAALVGSTRPFIVTAGTGGSGTPGHVATENDPAAPASVFPRGATEEAVNAVAARGVRTLVVRLPQVHDPEKQGLVTLLVAIAREKKVSAYVGDGRNRWPAVHRLAAAQLYRLVLEKGSPGARYHAVAEEGVPLEDIAEAVGKRVGVPVVVKSPEEAPAHFGFLAAMIGRDLSASSAQTREQLGWRPTGPSLIEDILAG